MADAKADPFEMTQFGIFYPRGHMVAVFQSEEGARKVQQDLLTGGYDPSDCVLVPAEEVARNAQANLEDHTGLLARLGKSDEAVRTHLNAARKGSAFLLIYAPDDLSAERAMNVVRRVPFELAHRYHRLAIQVLK